MCGHQNNNTRFNISCAALENSVYNYNGTSTGCPRDWLKSYKRYATIKDFNILATMKGWSEPNMAMAMPLYLRGPAMAWFDRLPRNAGGMNFRQKRTECRLSTPYRPSYRSVALILAIFGFFICIRATDCAYRNWYRA